MPSAPSSDPSRDGKELQAQAGVVLILAQRRSREAHAVIAEIQENAAPEQQWDAYVRALRAVFGADFMVLARFNAATSNSLQESFETSLSLQNEDAFASFTLFQRIAHVREALARLDTALIYANALSSHPTLGFVVGQLPYAPPSDSTSDTAPARWVGLAKDCFPKQKIPGGRLSFLALTDDALASTQINLADLSGLLVDEWVEGVPNASETTGIAFQYNEPSARPPQAILLAVAPTGATQWDLEMLATTVTETLDLAKVRMVDPDIVPDVGQYLPALFFAVNQAGDTASVDFRRLARKKTRRRKGPS